MEKFFEKIQQKYDLDDFTGNLGVFLDLGSDLYNNLQNESEYNYMMHTALQFIEDIYEIACECQMEK